MQALPAEKQRLQYHQDRLVEQAEKIMLSAYKVLFFVVFKSKNLFAS